MSKSVTKSRNLKKNILKYWDMYLLLLIPIVYFIIFKYKPMTALIIAFKRYKFKLGYFASPWAANHGFEWFIRFFKNAYFKQLMVNTISLSVLQLLFSFPVPIILAIIMNEIANKKFKKTLQLVTYAPHFISTVVLVAIVEAMCNPTTGIINQAIESLGGTRIYFAAKPEWFKPLYIISGIWQNSGYSSIIYLAALTNVDPQLIEAAKIDGANRLKIVRHITLPAIIPTAVILLIMNFGKVMSIGFEKAYLLQNSMNTKTSEIIATYIYKQAFDSTATTGFSYSTAVGLFNALINIILLLIVNKISKKLTETSLW